MHIAIVANGTLTPDARVRALWDEAGLRIAADGGARSARLYLGRAPEIVIGDFDSIDEETSAWLNASGAERRTFPRAKDQTDLELALDLAEARGADRITLLGAFGGRIDQLIGNVMLLVRYSRTTIADAGATVWLADGRAEVRGRAGDTVSLIPLTAQVAGIETEGLAYPLRQETLTRGTTRGISNQLVGSEARVQWASGLLLVVHLAQEDK